MRSATFWQRVTALFIVCSLLLLASKCQAQPSKAVQAKRATATIVWLQKHINLRETGGNNRGPLIDSWARACGNDLGSEWCGLTQWADQRANNLPVPVGPAGSYNWFKDVKRTQYIVNIRGRLDSIPPGWPAGIYNNRKGRIAHIVRIISVVPNEIKGRPPRGFWCIAGNEKSGKNAGVHLTYYPAASIHAAANWLYYPNEATPIPARKLAPTARNPVSTVRRPATRAVWNLLDGIVPPAELALRAIQGRAAASPGPSSTVGPLHPVPTR
jgi:hypothetical protein